MPGRVPGLDLEAEPLAVRLADAARDGEVDALAGAREDAHGAPVARALQRLLQVERDEARLGAAQLRGQADLGQLLRDRPRRRRARTARRRRRAAAPRVSRPWPAWPRRACACRPPWERERVRARPGEACHRQEAFARPSEVGAAGTVVPAGGGSSVSLRPERNGHGRHAVLAAAFGGVQGVGARRLGLDRFQPAPLRAPGSAPGPDRERRSAATAIRRRRGAPRRSALEFGMPGSSSAPATDALVPAVLVPELRTDRRVLFLHGGFPDLARDHVVVTPVSHVGWRGVRAVAVVRSLALGRGGGRAAALRARASARRAGGAILLFGRPSGAGAFALARRRRARPALAVALLAAAAGSFACAFAALAACRCRSRRRTPAPRPASPLRPAAPSAASRRTPRAICRGGGRGPGGARRVSVRAGVVGGGGLAFSDWSGVPAAPAAQPSRSSPAAAIQRRATGSIVITALLRMVRTNHRPNSKVGACAPSRGGGVHSVRNFLSSQWLVRHGCAPPRSVRRATVIAPGQAVSCSRRRAGIRDPA